jgi:hypothetical protein
MTARSIPISQKTSTNSFQGTARPIEIQEKDISRFRSLVSAPIKGLAKGFVGTLRIAELLQDPIKLLIGSGSEPVFKKAQEVIEERIPTQGEFAEKGLERAGEMVMPALLSGAPLLGSIGRSLVGGFGAQAVEEAGGGALAQAVPELAAFAAPSAARRIVPSGKDQERILELGRRHLMTEEQLAPLMPEARKRRFFGRFAYGGEGTQERMHETAAGIGNIYQTLSSSPNAQQALSPSSLQRFANSMRTIGRQLPHAIRSQLTHDAMDLVRAAQQRGGVTGDELMNFYHDINSRYNLGRKQLQLFKNPIREALHSLNPDLADDFETINRMYQKSMQIGRVLRPSEYEELISLGEAYEVAASAATLEPGRLIRVLGVVGFRKFSEKMLTSPRLQNLLRKSQEAILQNNLPIIKKTGEMIKNIIEEDNED